MTGKVYTGMGGFFESEQLAFLTGICISGGLYLRERSNKELAEVLRAHLSQWVKRPKEGEVEWHVSPDLVPTWMTGENGELLLKSLPEWEAEAKLGA